MAASRLCAFSANCAVGLLFILLVVCSSAQPSRVFGDSPFGREPTKEDRLWERDQLWDRAKKPHPPGKFADAVTLFQRILVIKREVFGDAHEEVVGTLEGLADLKQAADDFAAAKEYRQQALDMQLKLQPPNDWHVTDARLDLAATEQLERMDAADRERLREAKRSFREILRLYSEGDVVAANPNC